MSLYECTWGDLDDYITNAGLQRLSELVARLPENGFDVVSEHANNGTVQASVRFDTRDPEAALRQFEAILHAATYFRALHNNLVAARQKLVGQET